MNKRDRYLLTEAYSAGYLNASFVANDGGDPIENSSLAEAEDWVKEVIAGNGGTIGQYIASQAPNK